MSDAPPARLPPSMRFREDARPDVYHWALVRKRRSGVSVPWYDRGNVVPLLARPRTRADCLSGPRPCPWVGCKHNLFLNVDPESGQIRLAFPGKEPWEMPAEGSCALDVAATGENKLEEVAAAMGVVRERVRQIEEKALTLIKPLMSKFEDHQPAGPTGTTLGEMAAASPGGGGKGLAPDEDDRGGRVIPDRFHIGDADVPEAEYLRAFWRVLLRWRPGFGPPKKKKGED
jgi:hypothetical protein